MLRYLLTLVLLASLTACSGTKKKAASSSSSSTVVQPIEQAPPAANYFYINHTYQPGFLRYTRFVNPDGTIDTSRKCGVDLDSSVVADKDITCVVDSLEWDLYLTGMSFDYNVPKTEKCVYLGRLPFYFWRYPVQEITPMVTITNTAAEGDVTNTVSSDPRAQFDTAQNRVTCDYDYTADGGPDCCEGTYEVTTTDDHDGDAGATTPPIVTTYNGQFTGKIGACLSGPAMQGELTEDGFPTRNVTRLETSEDEDQDDDATTTPNVGTYPVDAPAEQSLSSNLTVANAIDLAPLGIGQQFRLDLAPAHVAIAGDPGNGAPAANPAYEWTCYDEAKEMNGRIRVYVRDWNTRAALLDFQGGSVADPNEAGAEPDFPDQDYEDVMDWFKFLTDFGDVFPGKGP
jgi:hypothetical protein